MSRTLPIPTPEKPVLFDHPAINRLTAEFCQEVEEELAAILASTCFRSSRRSCEFFRHIVERVLEGRADSLKERALGVEVMGRPASYDTGADAAVRVRANDVRRRLGSYYEQNQPRSGIRIELPVGSYVAQFVRAVPVPDEVISETVAAPTIPVSSPALGLRYLAAPTVLALFICAIAIRYELLGTTPWQLFWSELLNGRSQIGIVLDAREGSNGAVDATQVQASIPLVSLANAYRVEPLIRVSDKPGYDAQSTLSIQLSNRLPPHIEHDPRIRFVIRGSGDESRIVDRQVPGRAWSHAALITIVRGANPVIAIGGTDVDAMREGVRTLSDRVAFPPSLVRDHPPGELTQLLLDEHGRSIDVAKPVPAR